MPFYVNDYLSSPKVSCMTLEQQGAYIRLLCYCWASGDASLPDDEDSLAALSGMGEGWFKGGSRGVQGCFTKHPEKEGSLTHPKIWELHIERREFIEKSRAGGRKSAAKRATHRNCEDKHR